MTLIVVTQPGTLRTYLTFAYLFRQFDVREDQTNVTNATDQCDSMVMIGVRHVFFWAAYIMRASRHVSTLVGHDPVTRHRSFEALFLRVSDIAFISFLVVYLLSCTAHHQTNCSQVH